MKVSAVIRIVAFSLAILILSLILFAGIAEESYLNEVEVSELPTEGLERIDFAYFTTDVRNIEIEWVAGDITIMSGEVITDIIVSETAPYGSNHEMVCKQSGQTLKIDYSEEDFKIFGINSNDYESKSLVIRVPDEWIGKNIEIETASGSVTMDGITTVKFDFDGALGDCRLTNCDITEVDIDTASGNITFTGTLDVLDCDAASADCDIEVFNVPRSIDLDGMSGDLELILPPDAGFICNMDTMSGSFNSDFTFQTHDNTYVCGNGECKIHVNGVSGAVSILKGISNTK